MVSGVFLLLTVDRGQNTIRKTTCHQSQHSGEACFSELAGFLYELIYSRFAFGAREYGVRTELKDEQKFLK